MSDNNIDATDHTPDPLAGKKLIACGGGACNILVHASRSADVQFSGMAIVSDPGDLEHKFDDSSPVQTMCFEPPAETDLMLHPAMRDPVNAVLRRQLKPIFDQSIREHEKKEERVILIACLGGFVGSWVTPVLSQGITELGIPHAVIATMPFDFEGPKRTVIASEAAPMIAATADHFFVLNMSSIVRKSSNEISMKAAFHRGNQKAVELARFAASLEC